MHTITREMFMFGKTATYLLIYLDRVFSDRISSEDIFESECKKLILASMEGCNVTIFTYGQTASGKTYTMRGET